MFWSILNSSSCQFVGVETESLKLQDPPSALCALGNGNRTNSGTALGSIGTRLFGKFDPADGPFGIRGQSTGPLGGGRLQGSLKSPNAVCVPVQPTLFVPGCKPRSTQEGTGTLNVVGLISRRHSSEKKKNVFCLSSL